MATHLIDTLLIIRGFPTVEIQRLISVGLLERVGLRSEYVRTIKPPSRWPKVYREIWQNRMGKGRSAHRGRG